MLRTLLFLSAFVCFSGNLLALNPPPANDSVWDATNIGTLPVPPVCPAGGYGNPIVINGSTEWASYNTFDYSPANCMPGGSPDVWYRFTSTSTSISIDAAGSNGLDTFFIKLFHSQGSCYSLVPLSCETSSFGIITATFQTPEIGEEYYIQIGGNQWYSSGDFVMTIKSLKICNECVNESEIDLSPSPWFGRYSISDTITMCYTVDRWDYVGSADLHGIVPRFGTDWDLSTLSPLVAPQSYSATNGWHWFTGVNTPDGAADGYFFDPDNDGNPSNNAGDSAGVLSSWTGCWKIATLPFCNTFDLGVDIKAYSDDETGTGIALFACDPSPALHIGLSAWCCAAPVVSTNAPTSCNGQGLATFNTGTVVYDLTVYDTAFDVVAYMPDILGTYTLPLAPGQYSFEFTDTTNFGCVAYATVDVPAPFRVEMSQTGIGCGSGTAEVLTKPFGGLPGYKVHV